MRKTHIAVIGSASSALCLNQQELAYKVGRLVVESGARLLCGGMGGVMEYSAKGAHAADNYQSGDVVGILPSYHRDEANPYVDIPLPTGLGVARNSVLMAACCGVIALDGGSGTLSEIALAWQMKKPIACIGDSGWQHRLTSLTLDSRREDDCIQVLQNATEIPNFIECINKANIPLYTGIDKSKISLRDISDYLSNNLSNKVNTSKLRLLGSGAEGGVVTDSRKVYKLFYPNDYGMLLFSNLEMVAKSLSGCCLPNPPFPVFTVFKGEMIGLSYPYFDSAPYNGGRLDLFIPFLKNMKTLGLCMSNLKTENFRITHSGWLICIDIGRDVLAYSDAMFSSNCKRAFITAKFSTHPRINDFYRHSHDYDGFDFIANEDDVLESSERLTREYNNFYAEIVG